MTEIINPESHPHSTSFNRKQVYIYIIKIQAVKDAALDERHLRPWLVCPRRNRKSMHAGALTQLRFVACEVLSIHNESHAGDVPGRPLSSVSHWVLSPSAREGLRAASRAS